MFVLAFSCELEAFFRTRWISYTLGLLKMKTTFGILVGIFLVALAAGKVEYLKDDDTIVVEGKPLI